MTLCLAVSHYLYWRDLVKSKKYCFLLSIKCVKFLRTSHGYFTSIIPSLYLSQNFPLFPKERDALNYVHCFESLTCKNLSYRKLRSAAASLRVTRLKAPDDERSFLNKLNIKSRHVYANTKIRFLRAWPKFRKVEERSGSEKSRSNSNIRRNDVSSLLHRLFSSLDARISFFIFTSFATLPTRACNFFFPSIFSLFTSCHALLPFRLFFFSFFLSSFFPSSFSSLCTASF